MSAVIRFDQVSKHFTLYHNRPRSIQEMLLHLLHWRPVSREEFYALREVSFEIAPGETVGLIGPNGSGKSTALKMMAGILPPTSGTITVNGRISALLELGAGFHPDLTGRENVYLNAALLGISRAEIKARFDEIVGFAEMEHFIDMPVKHYSSGMYMRLGFSVAIHTNPQVLLVDEVLAVGDQAFQTKCLERIYLLKQTGTTIVIVSHALDTMRQLCSRLIWIERGDLRADGGVQEVASAYLKHVHDQTNEALLRENRNEQIDIKIGQRWGSGEVEITGVRLLDDEGQARKAFQTGEPVTVEISYLAHEPVEDPVIGMAIYRHDGAHINGPNTRFGGLPLKRLDGAGVVRYRMPYMPLLAGTFYISVSIYDTLLLHAYDHQHMTYSFRMSEGGSRELYGIFEIPGAWSHEAQGWREEGTPWPMPLVSQRNGHGGPLSRL